MNKIRTIIGSALLFSAMFVAVPATSASIEATDVCVTVRENAGNGDTWTYCGLPTSIHQASLYDDTNNLVNGCTALGGNLNNWSNCISSLSYTNLPGNYRLRTYDLTNYSIILDCFDLNGSPGWWIFGATANDKMSSWRVEGGNC